MIHTIFYISVIAQLAHPHYVQREKAYRWLHDNPHSLIQVGCKLNCTEIRIRSLDLYDWYCESTVRKLGYMPMLDSAWYCTKTNTYLYQEEPKFLGKYDTRILKQLLDSVPYEENTTYFSRYRSASKIWFVHLMRNGASENEMRELFNALWQNDLLYLKNINHPSYQQALYLSLCNKGK